MMELVIGGSGSGKSSYAEKRAVALAACHRTKLYYLATMQASDAESRRKIARHRRQRQEEAFMTIEQPRRIGQALADMEAGDKTVLLECLSNLAANEMFTETGVAAEAEVIGKLTAGIEALRAETTHLIVVGNDVFGDGVCYGETTMGYLRVLGAVQQRLAAMADRVTEVTAGIPLPRKGTTVISETGQRRKEREAMQLRLVIGGYAQGKLGYVLRTYGLSEACVQDAAQWISPQDGAADTACTVVVNHLHAWVRTRLMEGGCPEEEIWPLIGRYRDCILISDEIGCGIVPVDPAERAYRERMGRLLMALADRAAGVERVICGIGQSIK